MTNSNSDELSNDLETVKKILLAIAKRAEATDSRLERLAEASVKRWSVIGSQLDRLAESQQRTQEQLDQLREDVDIAFQTINLMAENNISLSKASMFFK
jgi:flagellar biosynthesis chaperone FliJ